MDSRKYQDPFDLPPSYDSIVNNYQQEYPAANQVHHQSHEENLPGLDRFVRRYEISPRFAERLHKLKGYEIVFICDDSGSMNTPLGNMTSSSANGKTRWDELKQTVSVVVDLASIFDPDGVDIYFLNREPLFNVRNSSELETIFAMEPEDGVPTDERERPDTRTLEHVLKNERQPTHMIPVTIIACTDDDNSMEYLNDWDRKIPNLDVVDDYQSEKKEIQACQGQHFPFNFGDYIVKILMGGVDSWFDDLDEKKVT